jgi:hypothetical protein
MKLAAIMAGVLLLAAAAGRADAQNAEAPPASAASVVQQLLKGAANPGDFADLSSGGLISLKHKPSGLICVFGADPQGNSLHASPEGLICETQSASEIDTLEAFHAALTSDEELQGVMGRAMGQFEDTARPVSGFTDSKSDRPKAPPHVSRRFVAMTRDGQQLFLRIAYSQVGDWFVLQRVISTPASAQLADADGERRLLAAIGQVMDREAQAPGR